MLRRSRLLSAALLAPAVLSGCRMYGSYDATDLTIAQYEQALAESATAAQHLHATWSALDESVRQNPALQPVLDGYAPLAQRQDSLVRLHQEALERIKHPGLIKRLVGIGGYQYRVASEAYGALATDQAILNDRLIHLGGALSGQPQGTTYVDAIVEDSRYVLTPPFFHKLRAAAQTPDLLASSRAYRAPAADTARATAAPVDSTARMPLRPADSTRAAR